ncbi:alpha/beta fold hydrolase [uncultured Desulfuromonas sp.]|uniref:alpha/beta fold hydrolase n=1 Tax=uncultured Desulfuromonas sp. TaxID=181013 RepID=UPI002AABC72F|nr:alpha/beta fold hydrolase [uncultured Desulfuromonas sp.]
MVKRLLPFQGNTLTLANNLRYHYLDEGQGDPVVMVHGNPSWCYYYRHLAVALSASHQVIVPDHIGCGLSDKPDDSRYRYTLEQRIDDLETLLDHLQIKENITLVVHDWGGMIGMAYATRYPERIKRCVVLNTGAFHLPPSKPLPKALKLCRDSKLGAFLVRGFNAFSRGAAWVGCKINPMPPALRAAYMAPYNTWNNRIATLRFVQDIPLDPSDRAYAEVSRVADNLHLLADKPMFIGWGEKDFVFDHHFLAEWQKRFPNAQYHTWPRGGHYILEDVGDELIPLICRFIQETK